MTTAGSRRTRVARALGGSVVALALSATAACGGVAEPVAATTETAAAPLEPHRGTPPVPEVEVDAWPLTGVPSDEVVARPALAVKVENAAPARPQTGLEDADVVWVEVVEGGITRFVAVYHSKDPGTVGPIRSIRPVDPAIVGPLDGLLAYSGGQRPFLEAVQAAGIQSLVFDAGDRGFARDPARRAPHNIYGDTAVFWDQARDDRAAPPVPQLAHAPADGQGSAARAGDPAALLTVRMSHSSTSRWHWSADDGAWLRDEGTRPALSSAGVRLSAVNVVLLDVTVVSTEYTDPAGVPVPEVRLVGTGTGRVAGGGKVLDVAWSKEDRDAPLVLTGPDGDEVELDPGNTWIELVPAVGGAVAVG